MVRVAVVAELVVGDQDLRPHLADDLDQVVGRLGEIGTPERVLVDVVGRDGVAVLVPLHPGVAVGAEAAQVAMVRHAEHLHRFRELLATVLAEAVLAVGGQVLQLRDEDLAHLPGRAGHQRDAPASATYFAIVAPVAMVSSSGWAWTRRSRSSGTRPDY